MTDSTQNQEKRKSLKWVFLSAGALVIFDALFLNQGVISALIGAWMLLVAIPRAVFSTKVPELKRYRLRRAAVFIGAMAMVFVFNWANNQIARKRAETLIAAVKAFNQKHQRYPAKLEELAPDFIDRVPIAKYTLTDNSFRYISTQENHSLFYVSMPPFGRPTYSFERNEWFYVD
ncbi:MAG: hypothetical protein WA162_07340 [Thermodesulfobacteriota bacterium]